MNREIEGSIASYVMHPLCEAKTANRTITPPVAFETRQLLLEQGAGQGQLKNGKKMCYTNILPLLFINESTINHVLIDNTKCVFTANS